MNLEEKNEQLVRDFFRNLSTGDLETVRPLWHPDGSWEAMVSGIPGAGIHEGRDEIIDEFLAPVRGMFVPGDPKVKVTNIFGKGNMVACETHTTGKFLSGADYNNRYCWILEIKDGLIFRLREYMDSYYVSTLVPEDAPK